MSQMRCIVVFILAILLAGQVSLAQSTQINPLVPQALLKQAGLQQAWQNPLPIKQGESVEWIKLIGNKVYVLTTSNYLFVVDSNSGTLAFGTQLAGRGLPVSEPQLYRDQLSIMVGSDMMLINTEFGTVSKWDLKDSPVCPPVRNKSKLYVASTDNRLHVYDFQERVHLWDATAKSDARIVSVLADDQYVTFATIAGNVVRMLAQEPRQVWQFDALEKITAGLVVDGNTVYAGSWDTNLYKLRVTDGKLLWKSQMAGPVAQSPVVTKAAIYQYVVNRGISAINKESGQELWNVADARAFMMQGGNKVYLLTLKGTCAVVDFNSGKELYQLNFADVRLSLPNTENAKMFVADRAGRLACIVPAK